MPGQLAGPRRGCFVRMAQRVYNVRPGFGSTVVGVLVLALFVYGLFRLAAFTMSALVKGLPFFFGLGLVFLAIAYFVDPRAPRAYLASLGASFRQNPLMGLLRAAGTVLFAPFVFGWLLAKTLLIGKVRETVGDMQRRAEEQMRQRAGGAGAPIGRDDAEFTEVKRDDGLVIRIPKEE